MLIKDTCFNSPNHIKDKTVNLFFCDPPYNILSGQVWDSQWKNNEEFYAWTEEWIQLMYNQLNPFFSPCIKFLI